MTSEVFEPFFLETPAGAIFAFYRAPTNAERCVLMVAPFAEEMNKSRRQFAETSRGLLDSGLATLIIDPFGTGDSAGEFADATWAIWKNNIQVALSWARDRSVQVDSLVALRLGCMLAVEALADADHQVNRSVFWQPVTSGSQFMTQFLRLRVAASMMDSGDPESVAGLKGRLRNGEALEVAGYALSPGLWAEIEGRELAKGLSRSLGHLLIAEVGRPREGGLSPASKRLAEDAARAGIETEGRRVNGEPFWSATEIVVNPDLQRLTSEFIAGGHAR